jgi:hypothetical protein
LLASSGTCCTTSGWYHGGINICGLRVGHLNDPIGGLISGPLGRSPWSELPLSESPGCLPFGGYQT